ncbi:MAG TPA: cyclase family protein [Candidatus Binataceae bacterium]|jgi:kynurenine formamidase|nr:cyclase family protein [Candidatus Binataceae bacterium]
MARRFCCLTVGCLVILLAPRIAGAQDDSLTKAYEIIATRRFVDLTHTFSPNTPVWKGFGPATFAAAADPADGRPYTIPDDGFRADFFAMVGQYGTHIDPPAHFDPKGATLDQLPLKQMILKLVVFDSTPLLARDPNHAFTADDILAWERVHGRVPRGCFAALRTDLSKDWNNPVRFKRYPFPAWSLDAIRFLYEQRGIVANGHESLDTDTTPDMKSETWLLQHGHWQIEVMDNLDKVPATGALIVATWAKPAHGLGFPARAFAILP